MRQTLGLFSLPLILVNQCERHPSPSGHTHIHTHTHAVRRSSSLTARQIMTRPYFGNNMTDADYYRRPSRSIHLAISHPPHEDRRLYPLGRRGSRGSPGPDCEGDKNGNQPRRRIAVAVSLRALLYVFNQSGWQAGRSSFSQCGRCRKRKIKCSGDPGDGTGCNNCKSAGTEHGLCQFLRVRCSEVGFLAS